MGRFRHGRFRGGDPRRCALVQKRALAAGARDCLVSLVWAKGGKGAVDLAKAVVRATEEKNQPVFHVMIFRAYGDAVHRTANRPAKAVSNKKPTKLAKKR